MPEGHSIRHLATVHSYGFLGTAVQASSPQGRFAEGAELINNRVMTDVTCKGKHLFFHFDDDIVHIHLGLYGWFTTQKNKGQVAKDSIRLRITNEEYVSDLVGPTACEIFDKQKYMGKINSLGPDPLRDDADPEEAWQKIKKSKKTVGQLLMDQSVIAGIGNVYRAELLFLSNQSPFVPGKELHRDKFDSLWRDSVRLLTVGAEDGKIKTVAEGHLTNDEVKLHGCSQTSYVYKRTGNPCRVCSNTVQADDMGGRTLYWCPSCQPS
jgi:endonuclease-8